MTGLDQIEALIRVRDMARALVEECRGDLPPSLGSLARLEDALAMEWKTRPAEDQHNDGRPNWDGKQWQGPHPLPTDK